MKKNLTYLLLTFMAYIGYAQNINFTDNVFKERLLSANKTNEIAQDKDRNNIIIDSNGDGEIQFSEAMAVYYLNLRVFNDVTPKINSLTEIEFFSNLIDLNVNNNNLRELDVSKNTNLKFLMFEYNNLKFLNLKNTNIGDWFYEEMYSMFNSIDNDGSVCVNEDHIFELNRVRLKIKKTFDVNSYCITAPAGNSYNTITGNVFIDLVRNGKCSEKMLFNNSIKIAIEDNKSIGYTFTGKEGNFSFYTGKGEFKITPQLINNVYYKITPQNYSIKFSDIGQTENRDFCFVPDGIHRDLNIIIKPLTRDRPGFETEYEIIYTNLGTETISQEDGVHFNFDNKYISYVSTNTVPSKNNNGKLSWSYKDLKPFETRSIKVILQINTPTHATYPVNLNDILTYKAQILPIEGDEMPADNTFDLKQIVVAPYDPNDITCLEGEKISVGKIGDDLHYLIRFENTGNYQAERVVVTLDIDTEKYDPTSFYLLNTSHDAKARITKDNKFEIFFENINLEAKGQGNILFKIKTLKNLIKGDFVINKADIYFDYNKPIETNEAKSFFDELLNTVNPTIKVNLSVYPNPIKDKLTIESVDKINSLELYDLGGKLIKKSLINENKNIQDLNYLKPGVYIIKIETDKGVSIQKIVKQ